MRVNAARRAARSGRALLLALIGSIGFTTGCTQVVQTILQVGDGSGVAIQLGSLNLSSDFSGGIDSTAEIEISFFDLLLGRPLDGTVAINELLIAGTPIVILPGLTTGTLCVAPIDPDDPGSGTIEIDLKHRELHLTFSALTGIVATDPVLGPALGVFEFPVEIEETSPVSLVDLIGALGGGALPIDIAQEIDFVIDDPGSLLNGAHVTGLITLAPADALPSNPLLDECAAFLAP
jgi:hypothetical protein